MDKITYLAELAEGLARWVPERERQDILRYYAEYFEEAGPEREAEVVAELGDPWALSSRLAVEGGYVTWEKAASWTPKKRWPRVLLGTAVGLTIFALVFSVGMLAFNVVRGVRSHAVPEFGQATVVQWDAPSVWGEYDVAFVDDPSAMGYYFVDGESVASFSSIDVDVSLGNIEVVAGDDFTMSLGWSDNLRGYEPAWEVTDGVLRIWDGDLPRQTQAAGWDDLGKMFSAGQLAVDVTITVPGWVGLDEISVKTGVGDVLVYGVSAETVTAESGVGDVECYEARNVRRLGLSTGLGDVGLILREVRTGLNIGLKSGLGDVEVNLACPEWDCAYELESGMGTVSVNGGYQNTSVKRGGDLPYTLSAASGMGDVSVYFTVY